MFSHWIRKWTAFDLAVLVVYLIAFFVFVQNMKFQSCVMTSDAIKKLLLAPMNDSPGYHDVRSSKM